MDGREVGLIGGIVGSVLGILGGVVGSYFSIKNTNGPRERAFMTRLTALGSLGLATFLFALWLTPSTYRPLLWIPYAFVLPWSIRAINRRQEQIRREESLNASNEGYSRDGGPPRASEHN